MWGNARGWIISLILAALMGGVLAWSAVPYRTTPPTNEPVVALAMKPVALPTPPTAVVPAGDPCDAGEAYRAAIEAYQQDPTPYETYRSHASLDLLPQMRALEQLTQSTHCSLCTLFRNHPAELINYLPEHPRLQTIQKLGDIGLAVGLLYKLERNFAEARRYFDATFSLGNKLFQERVTFEEMGTGLGLMRSAAQSLNEVAKQQADSALIDATQNFMKQADEFRDQALNTYKILGGIDESYAGKYAGDLLRIAQSYEADPMWRVEAIKHLGHYLYNAPTRGDELAAKKVLQNLSNQSDIDPTIRAAAVAARDLTLQQHRTTR